MCSSVDYKIKKNQDQMLAMTWAVAIVQLETMPLIVITIRKNWNIDGNFCHIHLIYRKQGNRFKKKNPNLMLSQLEMRKDFQWKFSRKLI